MPASRAGRLSATVAIATGRAPRPSHGYAAHRLLGRARVLPRPVTIGLAGPFTRPARTLVTLAAILVGAAAVTFGTGLGTSLDRVGTDVTCDGHVDHWERDNERIAEETRKAAADEAKAAAAAAPGSAARAIAHRQYR